MEGEAGNLYVETPGIVVEDEEIGKMGRWPIGGRCELILQFTRALGQEPSHAERAIVINNELHPRLCDVLRQQEMQRDKSQHPTWSEKAVSCQASLVFGVAPMQGSRATSSSTVLVIWFRARELVSLAT
jgi:hypothetical protein